MKEGKYHITKFLYLVSLKLRRNANFHAKVGMSFTSSNEQASGGPDSTPPITGSSEQLPASLSFSLSTALHCLKKRLRP